MKKILVCCLLIFFNIIHGVDLKEKKELAQVGKKHFILADFEYNFLYPTLIKWYESHISKKLNYYDYDNLVNCFLSAQSLVKAIKISSNDIKKIQDEVSSNCGRISKESKEAFIEIEKVAKENFDIEFVNRMTGFSWDRNDYFDWLYGRTIDILKFPNFYLNYKQRLEREGKL